MSLVKKYAYFCPSSRQKMSSSKQVGSQSKKSKILSTQVLNDPYVLRDKSALFYGPKPYSKASLMVPQCNAKKTLMDSLTQCVIMQTENCVVGKKEGNKGQLISKRLFDVFNSSKNRMKNFCPNKLGQKFKFLGSFFVRIEDWCPFEIK